MTNYISIGVDARIGLGFDKHRSNSIFKNKCRYCWEGFKKLFISTSKMNSVIESLEELEKDEEKPHFV